MVPADAKAEIFANPPVDAEAFLDAVIAADGKDPTLRHPYSKQDPEIAIVNDWLYDGRGRGSVSGLPLYPPDE
jgi:hypothetical protein